MISYQFHVLGGDDRNLKMALILFPTWSAVALAGIWAQHSRGVCNVDASGWEGGSGSWLIVCCAWEGSQGGGASLCLGQGLPLWSCPPFGLSWVTEIGCHSYPLWGGGASPATSDNGTAAETLGAVFLLFLGMENGEDCFIKNCFETFLGQGRAFQVALCSNLKHKERRERRESEAQWGLPSAQPGATAACLTRSPGMVGITFPSAFQLFFSVFLHLLFFLVFLYILLPDINIK